MVSSLFQRLLTRTRLKEHNSVPLFNYVSETDGSSFRLVKRDPVPDCLADDYSLSANCLVGRSSSVSPIPTVDPVDVDNFENLLYN